MEGDALKDSPRDRRYILMYRARPAYRPGEGPYWYVRGNPALDPGTIFWRLNRMLGRELRGSVDEGSVDEARAVTIIIDQATGDVSVRVATIWRRGEPVPVPYQPPEGRDGDDQALPADRGDPRNLG